MGTRSTYLFLVIFLCAVSFSARAQNPLGRIGNLKNSFKSGGSTGDSLQHRDKNEDSISIRYRFLDSTRNYHLDSTITDFTLRYPIKGTDVYLGNIGLAARSILFDPRFSAGWDPGFHALDNYKFKLEEVRFYTTTRPYSELNYILGSRSEQIIDVMHTRNIKPNWNIAFEYRLINSPGFFKNQKTNHNNHRITSWYQSVNRRYNNFVVILNNKLQASENGGILDDQSYLDSAIYKDRFTIPTRLGGDNAAGADFLSTNLGTSNKYTEVTLLLRQQYDFGRKDSLVTDSTVIPLFYPRLRFEHTLSYTSHKFVYEDAQLSGSTSVYKPDSTYYQDVYGYTINPGDTVYLKDRWKELVNDFSIYQFPDANNLQQFFKVGASIQNLTALLGTRPRESFYNIFGHAEYRNKTRNLKWDIEAHGKLYFTGLNAGDYEAYASLQRLISKKIGYLQLGFENVNQTPSFIFDPRSAFHLTGPNDDFKKQNSTHLFASLIQPAHRFKLSGDYYLLTNYTYITNYDQFKQESGLFNVLRVSLLKTIRLGKRWNWHSEVYFQQVIGNGPVNLPLVYTRNRIAYEGNLGLENLDIALGAEVRYHTPYKADGYASAVGQFFYQDDTQISNLPDIAAYVNFRIKGIKFFIRAENLNTATTVNGFGFTNNNFVAPNYPLPGLVIRVGVFWSFVN